MDGAGFDLVGADAVSSDGVGGTAKRDKQGDDRNDGGRGRDAAVLAVLFQDLEGKIIAWSPGAERVFGLDAAEVLGHVPDEFIEWEDYKDTESVISRILAGESKGSLYEGYRSRADGSRFKASIVTSPIIENGGVVTGTACIIRDESEQDSHMLRRGTVREGIDSLTGALSRWAFTEWLDEKMQQRKGILIRVDLDNFRLVNERYGSLGANQLLRGLTRTLRRNMATGDALARLGGDEFAMVVAPAGEVDATEIAHEVLERIRGHVEPIEGNPVTTTASIGAVNLNQTGATTAEELLAESDRALVEAKAHGKDRFVISDETGPTDRTNLFELGARLRSALADNRLELFLQPIVSTTDLEVVMYETLVRMREDDELVAPGVFLPAAENLGVIHEVDRVVVRKALDLLEQHETLRLTVNLSGKSLDDRTLLEMLSSRLEARPQVAGRLVFEVTETSAVVDIDAAQRFSQTLQELGCDFALDDFGAGFASFTYLKRIPSKYLKIDGQFVGPPRSKTDDVVIDSVVNLGRALEMITVAEFVEDEATLKRVTEAGVDLAQGYHLGRPMPVDEALVG